MTHWYHFLLDSKTVVALLRSGELKSEKEVAAYIVKVFKKCYWLVESHHFMGSSQRGHYRFISQDLEDERISLWLPFPEELYQRLKSIHNDLDYYSIAQVVRLVIHLFLKMRRKGSLKKTMNKMTWFQNRWFKFRERFRMKAYPASHMRYSSSFSKEKLESYVVFYNKNTIKTGIFRC